jgi:hypothetical protein
MIVEKRAIERRRTRDLDLGFIAFSREEQNSEARSQEPEDKAEAAFVFLLDSEF